MAVNAFTYVKNVGKSLGYSAIDVFKEYNPAISAGVSNAKDFAEDLYQTIGDFKESLSPRDESNFHGKTKGIVKELWGNLIEDAKSGNWYNKVRSDKNLDSAAMAMFGFDGEDNPFDFDFDSFDDFDDDGSFDMEESTEITVESERKNAAAIITAMDSVASKTSTAIGMATAQSAQYIVESGRENARIQAGTQARGFHQLSLGIGALNANMASLVSLGEPLTSHMQNSATFYTKSTELQQQMVEHLSAIVRNTTPAEDKQQSKRKTSIEDFLDEGVFNIASYFDFIKEQVAKAKKEVTEMTDMFGGFEGIASMMTGSPLKMISDQIVRTMIPKQMKDSMKNFNDTISNFFLAGMNKIQKKDFSEYGLLGQLFDSVKGILLPADQYTESVSTGLYNKGKVSWDGVARKSLVEVIPTQLAHIEAAISGGPVMLYDFDRGKFVSKSKLKKEAAETKQGYANRAGGEFRDDLRKVVANSGANDSQKEEVNRQIDAFFLKALEKGTGFEDVLKADFDPTKFGIDAQTLELIRNTIKSYGKNQKFYRGLGFASNVRSQREAYGRRMRSLSDGALDSEIYLHNNSKEFGDKTKTGGILGLDQYNHDIFFYLQGIYQYTGHLSDNILLFGSGGSGGKYRKRGKINNSGSVVPVRDITTELTDAQIREQQESIRRQEELGQGSVQFTEDAIDEAVNGKRKKKKQGEHTTEEATDKEKEDKEDRVIGDSIENIRKILTERTETDESTLSKKAKDAKDRVGKFQETIGRIFQAPTKVATDMLNATQASLYRLIFGQDAVDEPGIFDYFFEKADSIFNKVDKFFDEKMGISIKETAKNIWTKFVGTKEDGEDEFEGGIASGIANGFRSAMGSVKEFFVGSLIDDFGTDAQRRKRRAAKKKSKDGSSNQDTNPTDSGDDTSDSDKKDDKDGSPIDQAYKGRKVTRTGVIAVSEGELVIPSEYNPFYHGKTDKKKQKRNEDLSIRRFMGAYADGGTVSDDGTGETEDTDEEPLRKNFTDFFIEGGKALGNGALDFFKELFKRDEKQEKKDNDTIAKVTRDIFKDHGETAGTMAAGAIVGGGVSLLTGAVVGPLAGAAIGAGVALSIKSGEMQKLLFGDVGEDGKRHGGLLNEKMTKFFQENVPDMAKGAAAGLVGGTFLGSPVLGAFLGATVGYVKSSDSMKDKIFGELVDGKRSGGWISRTLQDKVKKAAPNIGAGIIAGMVAGPFGLLPNLMIGGALGYVSSTEDFKDKIFGEVGEDGKRHGGVVEELRKKLFGTDEEDGLKQWFEKGFFEPARGIIQKLGNEMRIHGRNMWGFLGKTLRKAMVNAWESEAAQRLRNSRIGKVVGKVGKVAGGIAKMPFKAASGVLKRTDEALDRRALERGYGLYNNAEGRWMTAEERKARREELMRRRDVLADPLRRNRMQNAQNFDNALIGATPEQLKQMREQLQQYEDPTKIFDEQIRRRGNALSMSLDEMSSTKLGEGKGLSDKEIVKLLKAAKRGKTEDFESMLGNANISDEQKETLRKKLSDITESRNARQAAKVDKNSVRERLNMRQNVLTKYGFDIEKDGDIKNYLDLIEQQIKGTEKTEEQKKQEEQDQQEKDNHDNIQTISDYLADILTLLGGGVPDHGNSENEDKKGKTAKDAVNEEGDKIDQQRDAGLEDGNDDIISQYDPLTGEISQLVRGRNGDLEPNLGDNNTRQARETQEKFKQAIFSIPMIGGALNGLSGIVGLFKDKLIGEGDGEKKPGLLSKLFDKAKDKLIGENGYLSGLFHHLTGSKFGEKVSSILGRVSMVELAGSAIAGGLFLGAVTGKLDGFFAKMSESISFLKGNDTGPTIANNNKEVIDGVEVYRDENGEVVKDEEGRILTVDGEYRDGDIEVIGHNDGAQAGTIKNAILKTLSKKGSVMTAVGAKVGNTALKLAGKEASLTSANFLSSAGQFASKMGSKVGAAIMEKIFNLLAKLPEALAKIKFLPSSLVEAAPEICQTLYTHLDDAVQAVASKGGKLLGKIGSKISKFMPWVVIGNAVLKGLDAWTGGAASILGITDEPTVGQKIIACLVAVVNALIPVVGDLIPDKVLVNIFMDITSKLGIAPENLEEQRKKAEEIVNQYNMENGTDYTIEQYNEYVNGQVGWVKGATNKVKSFFANLGAKGTKETASSYMKGSDNSSQKSGSAESGGDSGIGGSAESEIPKGPVESFVSQMDSKYANIPYSNSTIGDIGCAPAAATMMANQINPGSLTMEQAIQEAQPYSDTNGTSADYFGSVLSKSGVAASYLNKENDITTALRSGKPTVLLGQNINNHDKELSPFGPNKHFVVARYMDANGNIVVDDPESNAPAKTYGSNILKNVSLGVSSAMSNLDGDPSKGSSESGGTANVDTTVAQNVWGYLTSKGYSPEVAAGILGNMRQESGVDPTKTQIGSQNAAGIVQWESFKNQNGRWKIMSDYAASKGKDWTDLQSQLDMVNAEITGDGSVPGTDGYTASLFKKRFGSVDAFKQVNDLATAVKGFCELFERPGKPELDKRLGYAKEYYQLYNGSTYTGTFDSETGSVDAKEGGEVGKAGNGGELTKNETGSSTEQTKPMGLSGVLSAISAAFTNAFNPSKTDSETGSTEGAVGSSVGQTMLAGANGEYAADPNATGGTGTPEQNSLVNLLKEKVGQLQYSMKGPRNPDAGSSDCSSTVNWAYKKVYGKDIGNDTGSILANQNTEIVDMAENMDQQNGGKNGSGPHIDKLQPGDILLYSRPDGGYTAGRPFRVGHVEMYAGEGQRIGHGGPDPGPKLSDATKDAGRYIMAKRLKGAADSVQVENEAGAGSRILDKLENSQKRKKYTGGSSGLSSSVMSGAATVKTMNRLLGNNGGEGTGDQASSTPPSSTGDSGIASSLQTLIGLVQTLVTNTSSIPTISSTLTNYCGAQAATDVQEATAATGAAAAATEAANAAQDASANDSGEDRGLQDLMDTLNAIATG